jgi:hypothetical protein
LPDVTEEVMLAVPDVGSEHAPQAGDRRDRLAASILRNLPQPGQAWAVLKNHDGLPHVSGDIDLCAGRGDWSRVTGAIKEQAHELGKHVVVACDHYLGVRLNFVVPVSRQPVEVLEIDLADGIWWKGAQLLSAEMALRTAEEGRHGYPVVSRGVEAAFLLTVHALGRAGELDQAVVASKGVLWKAQRDEPEFLRTMALLHGQSGVEAATAFLSGRWRGSHGIRLIVGRWRRATRHPARRSAAFLQRKSIGHCRGVPRELGGSLDRWIDRIAPGHDVVVLGG